MGTKDQPLQRKLCAILYADVAGYSRLTGQDEEGTHRRLRTSLDLIAASIRAHRGRVVHYAGDAVLADFNTVIDALDCALTVQEALAEGNRPFPEDRRLEFRIGVNLGDVIVDEHEIYGDGVNVAARLETLAEAGGICVSESLRTAAGSKLDCSFEFMGEQVVKNIAAPVRAYRVLGNTTARPAPTPPALPEKPSIAVLAFQNMSNDPEQSYFSDGVAEDIITDLSKVAGLFVVARNSAFAYKDRQAKVQDIGRELGVRHVLEGSVRRSGSRVRINAQLVDASSGGHLWAERYDRDLTDIFAVQDEVTREIVAALALHLTPAERKRIDSPVTDSIEAYDYFLRGREQDALDTAATNAIARAMLYKAVSLDQRFSSAFSYLARNHVVAYTNQWGEDWESALATGLELAHKAVALDDTDAHAHYALSVSSVWARQHETAISEARRAIALDPSFSMGHDALGQALLYAGQPRGAVEALTTGMRLDPLHRDVTLHVLAAAHFQLHDYERAIDLLQRRLIRKPDTDISRVLLAAALGHVGEVEKGRAEWERALAINPAYSLDHRRRVLPFRTAEEFDHFVAGLRLTGAVA